MTRLAFFVPAALAVLGVAAQSCSNSETLTLTSSADAGQVAACTTYSGSIALPTDLTDAPDGNGHTSLSINGVQKIVGNVTINNAITLASISFGDLEDLSGLQMGGLTVLSSLSLPQINTIDQLNLTALPALQSLSFGSNGVNKASSVLITNTGLGSLQGLDQLSSVDSFNINNNNALSNISLQVTNVKNAIKIEANDGYQSGLVTSFPMLQSAMNMTFRNCSEVYLPALNNVTQYLGFYGNTMQNFSAPNLTTTGGLVFVDNTALENVSIPMITSVNGSLQIANNTMLKKIDGIQDIQTITASLDFNGNFSEVDLPNLKEVKGAFNLQTSAQFDCSTFNSLHSKGVIRGNYVCAGTQAKPGGAGTKPSGTGSSSSSTKSSEANAPGLNYQMIGGTSILAGFLSLFL